MALLDRPPSVPRSTTSYCWASTDDVATAKPMTIAERSVTEVMAIHPHLHDRAVESRAPADSRVHVENTAEERGAGAARWETHATRLPAGSHENVTSKSVFLTFFPCRRGSRRPRPEESSGERMSVAPQGGRRGAQPMVRGHAEVTGSIPIRKSGAYVEPDSRTSRGMPIVRSMTGGVFRTAWRNPAGGCRRGSGGRRRSRLVETGDGALQSSPVIPGP